MSKKEFFYHNIEKFAVLIAFVIWGGACALGLLDKFEYKLYDALLGSKTTPAESEDILLVDIDDTAINLIGQWPWSRDLMSGPLMSLRELGAKAAVFDIEYLSESADSLNEELLSQIMENPESKSDELKNIYIKSDDVFAESLQFYGNSWLTINTEELGINYSSDDIEYAAKRFLYDVEDNRSKKSVKDYGAFSPAIHKFMLRASGAGFTNVVIDSDGTRRRIRLFANYNDGAVAQLSVAPLLKMIQPEKIIINDRNIILKNVQLPGKDSKEDIKVPLDKNGNMLIHWLKKDFIKTDENDIIISEKSSFQHNSFYFLWCLTNWEKSLVKELNALHSLEKYNFTDADGNPLAYREVCNTLLSDYQNITDYKNYLLDGCTGFDINSQPFNLQNEEEYEQYFALRKDFFNNVNDFAESPLLDELGEYFNSNFTDYSDEQIEDMLIVLNQLGEIKENSENYLLYFDAMHELYNGKICLIGNTGSSTTDLGTTPFANKYPNVGTHANVLNTILQKDFIIPVDWYWSVILAALITLAVLYLCRKSKVWVQNAAGVLLILSMAGIPFMFMALWGIYIPFAGSLMLSLTAFILVTVTKFVTSEKDKAFLQTTFGAYVAPAVVDQIVKNPEIARLGGKSDTLTALFSDVKTFSRFTEVVNNKYGEDHGAEKLVATLNGYLGALSDAIMNNKGTIDKYVGDEIVSFFGAPIHDDNNAFQACVAAIRMRQAEDKYNLEHESELPVNPATGKPYYLHSRIGLNTGNMVVGNMGTEKKLNYTIMGNNVNLASRLEGTNNSYGSWIMCSESTWNAADSGENKGKIVVRNFDYVRVINVKKPVRIYSIVGLKDEIPPERLEAARIFNEGMEWYLKGAETPECKKDPSDLEKAVSLFQKADALYPADESSKVFIQRCQQFIEEGLPEIWDGIYVMKSK